MKVLVATRESQGIVDDDYCWTIDDELVYIQDFTCPDPRCGCDRGFAGMSSSKATTTAKVVERPDLDPADLMVALCDSLERGGWIESLGSEAIPYVLERLGLLAGIVQAAPVGSLVRRNGIEVMVN
jgi:hypothetical protein